MTIHQQSTTTQTARYQKKLATFEARVFPQQAVWTVGSPHRQRPNPASFFILHLLHWRKHHSSESSTEAQVYSGRNVNYRFDCCPPSAISAAWQSLLSYWTVVAPGRSQSRSRTAPRPRYSTFFTFLLFAEQNTYMENNNNYGYENVTVVKWKKKIWMHRNVEEKAMLRPLSFWVYKRPKLAAFIVPGADTSTLQCVFSALISAGYLYRYWATRCSDRSSQSTVVRRRSSRHSTPCTMVCFVTRRGSSTIMDEEKQVIFRINNAKHSNPRRGLCVDAFAARLF
jgi:hypothetical protein